MSQMSKRTYVIISEYEVPHLFYRENHCDHSEKFKNDDVLHSGHKIFRNTTFY